MKNIIQFTHNGVPYFLKIHFEKNDRIQVFFETWRKSMSIFFLITLGSIGLGISVVKLFTYNDLRDVFLSFLEKNLTNLFLSLSLFFIIYALYSLNFDSQKKKKKTGNIRDLFDSDMKKVFNAVGYKGEIITTKALFQKIFQTNNQKFSHQLEISPQVFEEKMHNLSFSNDEKVFQDILYSLIENKTEAPITIYDFVLSAIHTNSEYQKLFFSLNIDDTDLKTFLKLLADCEVLKKEKKDLKKAVEIRGLAPMNKALTAKQTLFLNSVCTDMTQLARSGKYPYIIGREKEIEDAIRLLKIEKKGVLLMGDAGVGKSAIAEGLAALMASENVPKVLQDKRLMLVNTGLLISSSTGGNRAMVGLLEEAKASGNCVFVFDDCANLVGSEKQSEASGMDAFSVLSNYITNYNIKVLASITPKDYNQFLANSSATAARHLEKIEVQELPKNTVLQILLMKSFELEKKHSVTVSLQAIQRIYEFAQRYLTNSSFPTKGLLLLEEATQYTLEKGESYVHSENVAEIVSKKTNIKVTEVKTSESEKLLQLESHIHKRLIGQENAVKAVASALRRARLHLNDQSKTLANFLFLGPTGVGKTELAKALAEVYFGNENNMIRLDMSEYQERSSLGKIIGDANGGGLLTNAVAQNPFSLILLDELEKAHEDIFNLFLQVMDDGRLTDSSGNTINFRNTILIATSNAGSREIQKQYKAGKKIHEIRDTMMQKELLEYYKPEFLNRFDEVIVFHPLTGKHLVEIMKLLLEKLRKNLYQKRIYLEWDTAFLKYFIQKHYSFELGARPLQRAIQDEIGNIIAEKMLAGQLQRNGKVLLHGEEVIVVNE